MSRFWAAKVGWDAIIEQPSDPIGCPPIETSARLQAGSQLATGLPGDG